MEQVESLLASDSEDVHLARAGRMHCDVPLATSKLVRHMLRHLQYQNSCVDNLVSLGTKPRFHRAVAVTDLPTSTIHNSHASSSWVHDEPTSSVIASRFNLKQKLHYFKMTHS
jgi:hypothetical protein